MKALSLHQPFAWLIVKGYKPLESRSWSTTYRGDFVVQATKTPVIYDSTLKILAERNIILPAANQLDLGKAICVATIVNCRPFEKLDMEKVCVAWFDGYVFELKNIRPLKPFPLDGWPWRFFDVDDALVEENLIRC